MSHDTILVSVPSARGGGGDDDGNNSPTPSPASASIRELQPFLVEPIILARLHKKGIRPLWVAVALAALIFIVIPETAMFPGLFWRPSNAGPWWSDVWHFLTHSSQTSRTGAFPYLRDYPSLVLTATIAGSVLLVYALFRNVARLHSDMARTGCVQTTDAEAAEIDAEVERLNKNFEKWGRRAPLTLALIVAAVTGLNLALRDRLYGFLGHPKTSYASWWASLHPFRAGAIVWILFGALGIYMVYIEAIVGLAYVRLLGKRDSDYRFRANMHNPDGFYGWSRLRQI